MVGSPRTSRRDEEVAIHEAGHAVLQDRLDLGCESVTIVRDEAEGEEGHARHQGASPSDENAEALLLHAEEAFWLRHATAAYAGGEALRCLGVGAWWAGCAADRRTAVDCIRRITEDPASRRHLLGYARRRSRLLVEHYWPEIRTLAGELMKARTLTGKRVREIVGASIRERRGGILPF